MMKVHGRCSSVFMVSMKHASYVDRIHGLGDDAESSSVTCIVGRRPSAARSRPRGNDLGCGDGPTGSGRGPNHRRRISSRQAAIRPLACACLDGRIGTATPAGTKDKTALVCHETADCVGDRVAWADDALMRVACQACVRVWASKFNSCRLAVQVKALSAVCTPRWKG